MTKIERRHFVVSLLPGTYEQELADLAQRALTAAELELQQGPRRIGQKSKAIELAAEHDAMKAAAPEAAAKVTVWALGYAELPALKDSHPPRLDLDDDGNALHPRDKMHGANMDTFPHALLCASLVTPGEHKTVEAMVEAGARILDDELSPSLLHYQKLETGAWNVNMGAEQLPKDSLVSLLMEAREPESEEPSEPESAPDDSQATSQPRRTGS